MSSITKEIIKELVSKENPIIFDLGCNDASELDTFLSLFKNPEIYCFEIDPRAIQKFKKKHTGKKVSLIVNLGIFEQ